MPLPAPLCGLAAWGKEKESGAGIRVKALRPFAALAFSRRTTGTGADGGVRHPFHRRRSGRRAALIMN